MAGTNLTIAETVAQIRAALQEYIEATYHIGHPALVSQRRLLIEEEGALFRAPYIESTPRYTPARPFAELDIPAPAKLLFEEMVQPTGRSTPAMTPVTVISAGL